MSLIIWVLPQVGEYIKTCALGKYLWIKEVTRQREPVPGRPWTISTYIKVSTKYSVNESSICTHKYHHTNTHTTTQCNDRLKIGEKITFSTFSYTDLQRHEYPFPCKFFINVEVKNTPTLSHPSPLAFPHPTLSPKVIHRVHTHPCLVASLPTPNNNTTIALLKATKPSIRIYCRQGMTR